MSENALTGCAVQPFSEITSELRRILRGAARAKAGPDIARDQHGESLEHDRVVVLTPPVIRRAGTSRAPRASRRAARRSRSRSPDPDPSPRVAGGAL
jgi:hypothetical protein